MVGREGKGAGVTILSATALLEYMSVDRAGEPAGYLNHSRIRRSIFPNWVGKKGKRR